jgi:hypothetical protein
MRRDAERMSNRLCRTSRGRERSEAIQNHEAVAGLLRRFAPRNDALLVAALLSVLAVPSLAAPRSIADCERIQDADAYNRCLASFGPTRGQHGASYPGVASEGGLGGSGRTASRTQSRLGRAQVSQGRGGRMRMEFTPGRR